MATYTTRSTIILSLLVGALLTPLLPEAAATAATRPGFTTTKVTVVPAPSFSVETDEIAHKWTQDLFTAAGFEFPMVAVEFHRNEEACGGARGRTYFTDEDFATIVVCATHSNPEVEESWRQRTLLHELAHAWIDQNVSTERTTAFMKLRGLDEWSSRNVAWEKRATEHAAETLMWGIQGGDYKVDFRIDETTCNELATGYELLTGVDIGCEAPTD